MNSENVIRKVILITGQLESITEILCFEDAVLEVFYKTHHKDSIPLESSFIFVNFGCFKHLLKLSLCASYSLIQHKLRCILSCFYLS